MVKKCFFFLLSAEMLKDSNLIKVLKTSKYSKEMYKNTLLVNAKDILFYLHIIY